MVSVIVAPVAFAPFCKITSSRYLSKPAIFWAFSHSAQFLIFAQTSLVAPQRQQRVRSVGCFLRDVVQIGRGFPTSPLAFDRCPRIGGICPH
jgi:hypothetical protein